MTTTPILKNNTTIASLPIYDSFMLEWELMAAKVIVADFEWPEYVDVPVGAYIDGKGERFTINTVPNITKQSDNSFKYSVRFESELYRLYDKKLRHLNSRTFQFYGTLAEFANLIISNVNEIAPGHTAGEIDNLPAKTINFSSHTCRTALDTVAEAFGVEWDFRSKTLSFKKKIGRDTDHVFEVGRGKGLYTLTREYQNDKNIVTRAYGFGSSRNLPEGYTGTELALPEGYLEKNVDLYGVKEGDYVNEDIYAKVDSAITGFTPWTEGAGTFKVTDSTLNFNINDNLSPLPAKLSFTSGEMQGQEFEIVKFDNATKTYTLKTFVDSSTGRTLPDAVLSAAVGDTYTLFDIYMPAERNTAAITELRAATQEWLDENSVPQVKYSLEIDPLHARNNSILPEPGDRVRVIDGDLGIDILIRVTKVNYPYSFPEELTPNTKINIEIANFIPYTTTERIISDVVDTKDQVKTIKRTNIERARRNALNLRSLEQSIFDTDGLFDSDKINVGVLSAALGIFGVKSQNFVLNGVYINDNYQGDANAVNITSGTLNHLEISNPGGAADWTLVGVSKSGLVPTSLYYVYAKCNRTNQEGTFVITTEKIGSEDVPGYFHFLMGVIYPVNNGYRDSEFTNGIADINGNRLKIGKIVSRDGLTWFDLDNGEFRGKFKFTSGQDIQDAVDDTNQNLADIAVYVDDVNSDLSSLANSLGDLAFANAIEKAMLGTSILSGGFIKTELIQVDQLVSKIVKTAASGARIEIYGNTMDSYNPNGNLARRQTVENGIVKDKWYNTSGDFIYEWGQNGVVYAQNVPASWAVVKLRSLLTNPNANFAALSDAVGNSVSCYINQNGNQYVGIEANKTSYLFTAGQNPSSEVNRPYEGHKNTNGSIQGDNIPDGWYMYADTVLQAGVSSGAGVTIAKQVSSIVGFASQNGATTGGEGGATVTVNNKEDFLSAISGSTPRIVKYNAAYTGEGFLNIGSNKTILGLPGSSMTGVGLLAYGTSNIITRNMTISDVVQYSNFVAKEGAHHIWVDHCTFKSDRDHGDQGYGYYDGLLDVGNKADYVTLTFNKLMDNSVAMLIGFADDKTDDVNYLKTTVAYNYFLRCSERQPTGRFTQDIHVMNNYHYDGGYAVGATMGTTIRTDNNHYENINMVFRSDFNGNPPGSNPGYISGRETNKYTNCTDVYGHLSTAPVTRIPPYDYTDYLKPVDDVKAFVMANAGAILTEDQLLDFTMPAPSGAIVTTGGSGPTETGYILEFMYMTGGKVTNGMTGVKSLEPTHACTFQY